MQKTLFAFEGTHTTFDLPYTHMSYADGCLFYGLMNALLTLANRILGLLPEQEIVIDGGDRRRQDLGAYVGDRLWRHRELVDVFVQVNPADATPVELDVARPWRHAVRDLFVCVGADKDVMLCMNKTRAFAIGAMERPASDFVHAVPSLMLLTLLPFKGGIVTDGKIIHLSDEPSLEGLSHIKRDTPAAIARGVISTADELVAYSRTTHGSNQIPPYAQAMVDHDLTCLMLEAQEGYR